MRTSAQRRNHGWLAVLAGVALLHICSLATIAQEKYSWAGIAERLAEIYASLTGSRSAVAA